MNDPMNTIREKFKNNHARKKLTDSELQEFAAWIQTKYEAGEKISRAEMYEVRRWRIIYAIIIDGIVRDVGHTHQGLNYEERDENHNYRSASHIGSFNTWWRWEKLTDKKGKKSPGKHGYYDFLVAHLKKKGLTEWTRKNCPEIIFKQLDANNWTGHQSGAREEYFRQIHETTTKNVQPGGTGKGRKRGIGGDKPFGCVTRNKDNKRFHALWTDEHGNQQFLLGSCSDNIKTTHDMLLDKWEEVKRDDAFRGVEPPKSLEHYEDYFREYL